MASEDVVGKSTGESAVTTIVREGVKAPGYAVVSICKSLVAGGVAWGVFKILIVFNIMELSKALGIYGNLRVYGDYSEAMVLTAHGLSPIRQSSFLAMNKHQGKFLVLYHLDEMIFIWHVIFFVFSIFVLVVI
ncbi:unnamed protein product [Musa textilis]